MTEDKKKKPGLHKKISSIFEGVPLPQPGSPQAPSAAPGGPPPGQPDDRTQKPLPPPFQALRGSQPARGYESAPGAPVSQLRAEAKATGLVGLWQKIKDKLLSPKAGVSGTRQKVMLILIPVLFVVLLFVVISAVVPPRKIYLPPQSPVAVAAASDTKIDWEIPPLYPETLRDPMQPVPSIAIPDKTEPEKVPVKPEKPVVKGILYSEDNPAAIIGTRIVHEGDKIGGAIILKINRNSVAFEMDGKKWTQNVEP